MNQGESSTSAPAQPAPKANPALMRAIAQHDHPAVLSALHNNQDQNYLWRSSDGDQYQEYVDLTAAIYALKTLSKYNRWQLACDVASAISWDVSNAVMRYMLGTYAARYPILQYAEPIRQSHTAALLFGSSSQQPIVNTYNPAKRIARDILIKTNTDLGVQRATTWNGNPVTVETHLNNMRYSWNPLNRKDYQDLSSELGEFLRARAGIDQDNAGGVGLQGLSIMGVGGNNASALTFRNQRRGILVIDNELN